MTEKQTSNAAERRKKIKQRIILFLLSMVMLTCCGGEESADPDSNIPPTDIPPAGEKLSFDEQLDMIMEQIGSVAVGEKMTVSRSSSAEMTEALKTINEVSGDKVNVGLEFKKPDGSSIFMGFFSGIDVEGSAGAIEPMSFWLLEDGEVSQLNSALLTAEGAPNMVVGHFDFGDNVVDMTALVDDISPEAVATAVAKIETGTKPPSIVFIFSKSGDEVKAVYIRDTASAQYYQVDISGVNSGVFAKLSLMPVEMLKNNPEGMWVLPLSMEAQLEGIDWSYRWTEIGLEIFEVGGGVLITRNGDTGEWVSLAPVGDITPPAVEEEISYTPEQQALLDANLFYGLEFTQMGGQEVAYSPLDAVNDPHYVYENGIFVDRHPGRNQLETNLFPPVLEDGQSIWENLERDGAVWDQEMMAYHYVGSPDADPGHEQYYQPLMAVIDSDLKDIEHGKVNFAETIQSEDFVLGESGVKIDFYISAEHDYVKWWENLPKELSSQIYAEMYLEKFPSLKGKHVQVRVIAEDKTHMNDKVREETFYQGDFVSLLNEWQTGIIEVEVEGVDELKIATLSISTKDIKGHEIRFVSSPNSAFIWSLIIKRDGQIKTGGGHVMDSQIFENEARSRLIEESGRDAINTGRVEKLD